ncbi:hypothetical protein [Embleya scabrispora]|uniref:hypothetical protein n=1 Tax=Embleya scabrispora TaxID=159449 RepID=UPI0011802A18|nr:hypothetical protein [Embleya scabrispora]
MEALIPGLAAHRISSISYVQWDLVETGIGTTLPSDFKWFAECYPPLVFDGFLAVNVPSPGKESEYLRDMDNALQALRYMTEGDEADGYQAFPEKNGLLPWGKSFHGDVFHWLTRSDPDSWSMVIETTNGDWLPCPEGVTDFLARFLGRQGEVRGMPSNFPNSPVTVTLRM